MLADGPRRRSRRQFSDNFGTYNAHVSLFLSSSSSSASLNGEAKKNGPLSFIKTTTKLPFFSNVAVSSLRRKGENMKRNFFLIWFYFFADCFHRRGLGAGGQAGKHKETLFLLLFFSAAASKWKRNGSRKLEFDRRENGGVQNKYFFKKERKRREKLCACAPLFVLLSRCERTERDNSAFILYASSWAVVSSQVVAAMRNTSGK